METLTKEQMDKIDEIIKFMWTEDAMNAVIDNQAILVILNRLIGTTMAWGQFQITASIIQSIFAFGFMLGREPKLDMSVWEDALNEAIKK